MFINIDTTSSHEIFFKKFFFLNSYVYILKNNYISVFLKKNYFFKKNFFKFFIKDKLKNIIFKKSKFYKFIYIWVKFFWLKYSNNLYLFVKLYKPVDLTLFSRKYSISRTYQRLFLPSFKLFNHLTTIFHTMVKFKSLIFFKTFIKRFFKHVNFFKHKFLIFYIRKCVRMLKSALFKLYGINGLYIRFHGKIAKAGNSRKQKYLLTYNSISTNHSNNYLIEKFQIFTFTGSIGCTIIMSLK